jgi:hypothetical protein
VDDAAFLDELARRYVWWLPPEQALARRSHLLCQIMQLGTYEDVRRARRVFGDEAFRAALREAEPGLLDGRSWNYWHRVLFHVPPPPMPERVLPT